MEERELPIKGAEIGNKMPISGKAWQMDIKAGTVDY
jgi:hypothetical protein